MAAAPPKGWKVEYAKSGRAACKTCSNVIGKDKLRIARVIQSTRFDGYMPMWNHSSCIMKKAGQIKSLDDVEGVDDLRWEDNQKLRKYIDAGGEQFQVDDDDGPTAPKDDQGTGDYAVEVSKSSRAGCKSCNEKIMKDELRVSTMVSMPGFGGKVPAWRHAKCFLDLGWWVRPITDMAGFDNLSQDDQEILQSIAKPAGKTSKPDGKGSKRKIASLGEESAGASNNKPSKKEKGSEDTDAPVGKKSKVSVQKGKEKLAATTTVKESDLEKKLEKQSKDLWALKDELKTHVTLAEFRVMLAANSMDVSGTEQTLRDRCADGMMYGALGQCPMCQSPIEYGDGQYKCKGFLSAWSKCSYATITPKRIAGKWKIGDCSDNDFLVQWNKKQKAKKEERFLLPPAPAKEIVKPEVKSQPKAAPEGLFGGRSFSTDGKLKVTQAALRKLIEEAGGNLHTNITKGTYCVLSKECEITKQTERLQYAQSLNIPIVNEEYLFDCITMKKLLPIDGYSLDVNLAAPETIKVKVKGRSAVHEDSGLQDTGHILEVEKVIYNVTLNMSDLSTGINSYYILQVIEDDRKNVHHVFRKWGRVGNEKVGGHKIEKMGKKGAIDHFRRLFVEKTGNSWQAWEDHEDLEKQPGKFYLVDIDFGVNEDTPMKNPALPGSKSKLDPRVVSLMQLLFDIETYRAALMEFEINISEMPLGKLSKRHIERGFQVLTDIQNLIEANAVQNEGLLIDASNRFFTLIPSIHPAVISDKELLKSKIDMLEALRDIEIASQFIKSVGDTDEDFIDVNYAKLHCGISPIARDGDDFNLVKRYLERTHAPTHKGYKLQLEDVFEVDREGEQDAYKKNIDNRMLLWHGSRTTNFVGILSQGLRIAPPEAPVSGYMFGKGVYFADMVSKSAQYCCTSKDKPTGLLLLCEVALGRTKDLKHAEYMEKPRNGTNSTKGVGKTVPLQSEYEVWKDGVKVPCGKPVSSGSSDTSLLYNEYIVYDTAQVQLRYLLKVKFVYK